MPWVSDPASASMVIRAALPAGATLSDVELKLPPSSSVLTFDAGCQHRLDTGHVDRSAGTGHCTTVGIVNLSPTATFATFDLGAVVTKPGV